MLVSQTVDWLKSRGSRGKKKRQPKNKQTVKQDNPGKVIPSKLSLAYAGVCSYPKGVPRSFLQQAGYQFPRTTASNNTWINKFQVPISSNQIEPISEVSQDETQGETQAPTRELYSPSDIYDEPMKTQSEELPEPDKTNDINTDEKQTNVYDRLGPPQPKVPNLTINLQMDELHTDRTVIVEDIEDSKKYTPVDQREDLQSSTDPIVTAHLKSWPWNKDVIEKKIITGKQFMLLSHCEQGQLHKMYENPDTFVKVSITGYPKSWDKEDILDTIIECVRGKPLIPCFIELSQEECKFLVLDCRQALTTLHRYGFNLRKDKVDLELTISATDVSLKRLDFVPKLILRKIMAAGYDGERKLSLKAFTVKKDVTHFIYFPLNRISNQTQLMNFAVNIAWEYIVELDLSHNRLTSIAGFDLTTTTPRLRHLDLSHNLLDKLLSLVCCRDLSLESINLEGNPVCNDYTDPMHYIEVIKTLYPKVKVIDGVPIPVKGELPPFTRNYCPEDAIRVVDTVLEVYFPLLEVSRDQRARMQYLYDNDAVMTVTCRQKLRFAHMYINFRDIFLRTRSLEDGRIDSIEGAATITKHINKWPELEYDPTTFTVDVLYHSDTSTVIRVGGLLKLIAATLGEDEHLLAFTKTFVLKTTNGFEYKITNQMVYWDEPTKEYANNGFKLAKISRNKLSLDLDTVPNEELKEKLIHLFMKITNVDRTICEKCLASKDWHFKNALEYFAKVLKLDALDSLKDIA